MKLKKAKKMLKELGIDTVIIKDNDCASSNGPDVSINTGEPHKLDDATVVSTTLGYDDFEITYEKPSSKKEKKKKKKAKRKSAYDNEIARIQRNFRHYKTGEGQYEPSEEEKEKMEDQRQEQNTKQRKYPPKGNPVNNRQNSGIENNTHHQNPDTIRNNRRPNNNRNRNQRNSHSKESGTNQITNKPENAITEDKKEE